MTCTYFPPSVTLPATPFAGCNEAVAPAPSGQREPGPFFVRSKRPSGAENRRRRVARGLPRNSEGERASRRIRTKRVSDRKYLENCLFVAELKVQTGCIDCGYNKHPDALDFDHLPGTVKRKGVSYLMRWSRSAILAEIAKCEVVCANCHRIRTWQRKVDEGVAGAARRWNPDAGLVLGTDAGSGRWTQ